MSLPWTALTWQSIAAILAVVLAFVSSVAAYKASREQDTQAEDIKGWQMGGDSLPHLYPLIVKNTNGDDAGVAYYVKHHGLKYPVYDVQVRLQDLDNGPFLPDGSVIPSKIAVAGTLTSNTDKFPLDFRVFPYPAPDETKPRRVRVELPARNGLVLQEITLTPVNGRWVTNSKPLTKNHVPLDIAIEEMK